MPGNPSNEPGARSMPAAIAPVQDGLFEAATEAPSTIPTDVVGAARSVRPRFSGQRLRLAREARGLTQRDLAGVVGLTPAAISQYESGSIRPTVAALMALGEGLRFPCGFFAFDTGADLEPPDAHFRSLRSASSRMRRREASRALLLAEFVTHLERYLRLPAVHLPRSPLDSPSTSEIEQAAHDVRAEWSLPPGPIDHVVRTLERHGVVTTRLSVATERVDAFSLPLPHRPILVLGTNKGDAARSRFDAAHELGHLVMHSPTTSGSRSVEAEADAFAAAFLMPANDIGPELPTWADWDSFIRLKTRWKVSLAALLRRARDLGTISEASYSAASRQLSARGWRRAEPGNLGPPERPLFLPRCIQLLDAMNVTVETVVGEAHLPLDEVLSFIGASEDTRPLVAL